MKIIPVFMSNIKTMKSLTVATYNVHMWCDKNHSETQDRMIELTKVIGTYMMLGRVVKRE